MQNKIKLTILGFFLIILFIEFISNNNCKDKKFLKNDGIMYALSLDGVDVSSFPFKGPYRVIVSCEGADGKWLYDDWKLSVDNITGDVTCDIKFQTISKKYLNNYIIGLSGTAQGNGEVVNENGYRYEGKSPNNYVWFNNEYWRIIGVFDSSSHGQSNKNLVKIIRAEILNALVWDTGYNDWGKSSLKSLLNDAYYNAKNGTDSGYCYGYNSAVTANCNYTKKRIQSEYKNMIVNATWYLGGSSSYVKTVETLYSEERGSSTSATGYIGLMYVSDYGYSVLSSSCARTTYFSSYNSSSCSGSSWLYGKGNEWTINCDSSGRTGRISYLGFVESSRFTSVFRPVAYLDSSVYVIDGDGSLENPYIIGM